MINYINNKKKVLKPLRILFLFYLFFISSELLLSQNFQLSPIEHIFNGDFSKGNVGFFTDYFYSLTDLTLEGNYTITSNPQAIYPSLSSCQDHTPGTDSLMMAVNGFASLDKIIWMDTIRNLMQNQDFNFSMWATSLVNRKTAIFKIFLNGMELSSMMFLTDTVCLWEEYSYLWNSGTNNNLIISIVDLCDSSDGNDFALDDISLRQVCTLKADSGSDKIICKGDTTVISSIATGGIPPLQYSWLPQNGLSSPFSPTPTVFEDTTTTYYLTVTDSIGCMVYDTINVTVIPFPPSLLTTNKPTKICPCDSVLLDVAPGFAYRWSTGDTSRSIWAKLPGKYSVTITNGNLCSVTIDTNIVIINDQTTVQLDTVYANIGDSVTIPLHIISPIDGTCSLGNYYAEISFDKSLLVPRGGTPFGTVNGKEQVININGTASGKQLYNFEFVAVLGDSQCTDIRIKSFKWDCGSVSIDTISGSLCLKGLCTEPTARLFGDNGTFYLKQIHPNPATDFIDIEFGIIEEGPITLDLYNMLGEKENDLANTQSVPDFEPTKIYKPGEYKLKLNTSKIANGIYILNLKTKTQSISKLFGIVR